MLITQGGQLIRTPTHDVRIAGRATRGVTLFRVGEDDRIVSVAHLEDENGAPDDGDDEQGEDDPGAGEGPGGNQEEAG